MAGLKIAIAGKGGTGKTTLCALLAHSFAKSGKKVVCIDADPSPNLAIALGVPHDVRNKIVPISSMLHLIEERTGMKPGSGSGGVFSINPRVDDLIEKYGVNCASDIKLLVLGALRSPGGGCFCPESALLRAVLRHAVIERDEVMLMDMEAGVEHLGRSTAKGVDALVVVCEPNLKSVEVALRIKEMATDLGIRRICWVLNKCAGGKAGERYSRMLTESSLEPLGVLPPDDCVMQSDMDGSGLISYGKCNSLSAIVGDMIVKFDKKSK